MSTFNVCQYVSQISGSLSNLTGFGKEPQKILYITLQYRMGFQKKGKYCKINKKKNMEGELYGQTDFFC